MADKILEVPFEESLVPTLVASAKVLLGDDAHVGSDPDAAFLGNRALGIKAIRRLVRVYIEPRHMHGDPDVVTKKAASNAALETAEAARVTAKADFDQAEADSVAALRATFGEG
tara:strand:+ start:1470 stop:1811 length:342 start_codon:yes stop_codon:yes gene_type:complete